MNQAVPPQPHPPQPGPDSADSIPALAHGLCPAVPALSLAIAVLIARHLRFDAADPHWQDRDRLVIDPALPNLAPILARLLGAGQMTEAAAPLAVGAGVGLALGERLLAARFGRSLVDHRCWVLCTGADLATGGVQEAACLAGLWRLGRLTVIAGMPDSDAAGLAGFAANGWSVRRVAGADAHEIACAFSAAIRSVKPTLIACAPPALPPEPSAPLPPAAPDLPAWQAAGQRHAGLRRAWLRRMARHAGRADLDRAVAGRLPTGWKPAAAEQPPGTASSTATAIRLALRELASTLPELAQLPGAPGWMPPPTGHAEPPAAERAAGRLALGIGAALYGIASHGALLPVCAQPSATIDSVLPGLRAAACADTRLLQIVIEPACLPQSAWRASLRALPNLLVFRPADAAEALECLELAVRRIAGPTVLLLSEAKPPPLPSMTTPPLLSAHPGRTRVARGGYRLAEAPGPPAATLIASGPELGLALRIQACLARHAICVAIAALPCWELFEQQDASWRAHVLGQAPRIGLESGSGFGWDRWLGEGGLFLCTSQADEAQTALAIRRHLK